MRGIISPKLKDFIDQVNSAAITAKNEGVIFTPELVRENLNKLSVFVGEGPKLDYVQDNTLTTSSSINIAVRIYSPDPNNALPVVIHYHGGGHMCGGIELYDAISRKIAKAGNCIVITPEYRLAPEHPYPLGLNDCKYVLEHFQEVLIDLQWDGQVIIAGDSAGGAICTTLAMDSLENSNLKIDKQILIYPSIDYTLSSNSTKTNGNGYLLETKKVNWYFDHYFQHNEDRVKASPLCGKITNKLPKTLIFTAGCDPLRDEGIAYAGALTAAGVPVHHQHFESLIHAYMLLDSLLVEECQKTYQIMGEFIR